MLKSSYHQKLQKHFNELRSKKISSFFADENRVSKFTIELDTLLADFSKNHVTSETIDIFLEIAEELNIRSRISEMFSGSKLNFTENRSVGHMAIRDKNLSSFKVDNTEYAPIIMESKQKFFNFVNMVKSGKIKSYNGKPFENVVNIGIGGSYLGSQMAYNALKDFDDSSLKVYFISNVDAANLVEVLNQINPATTLFIIASKTFTTQETMLNATTVKKWFIKNCSEAAVSKHFVALSTNIDAVNIFGITAEYTFGFWDFVGGRYSIWSSIGLPLALKIGEKHFQEFLEGACLVDNHLKTVAFDQNIPFLMAVISVWYNNYFKHNAQAILGYDYRLRDFTKYIQQLDMESNGKSVNKQGHKVFTQTSPVIFGEIGTDSQHSFFQMLHQGTSIIPCDFIGYMQANHNLQEHQDLLIANLLAQSEALMQGKTREIVSKELKDNGLDISTVMKLAPHKIFDGNRPSSVFLFQRLTPKTLGMLCALYEHKVFIQGLLWNINSFDQYGVELGKQLSSTILTGIQSDEITKMNHSNSTSNLVSMYKKYRK